MLWHTMHRYAYYYCYFYIKNGYRSVVDKPRILLLDIPVDECTFCITFSFKAEGYTESELTFTGDVRQQYFKTLVDK